MKGLWRRPFHGHRDSGGAPAGHAPSGTPACPCWRARWGAPWWWGPTRSPSTSPSAAILFADPRGGEPPWGTGHWGGGVPQDPALPSISGGPPPGEGISRLRSGVHLQRGLCSWVLFRETRGGSTASGPLHPCGDAQYNPLVSPTTAFAATLGGPDTHQTRVASPPSSQFRLSHT